MCCKNSGPCIRKVTSFFFTFVLRIHVKLESRGKTNTYTYFLPTESIIDCIHITGTLWPVDVYNQVLFSVIRWKFSRTLPSNTPVFYVATNFASTLQGNDRYQQLLLVSLDFFVTSLMDLVGASLKAAVFHRAMQLYFCSEFAVICGCCVTFLWLLRFMSSK